MAIVRGVKRMMSVIFGAAELHIDNGIDEIEKEGRLRENTRDCIKDVYEELLLADDLTYDERYARADYIEALKILLEFDTKEKRKYYIQSQAQNRGVI